MPENQNSVLELLYKVSREFASALDLKTVLTHVLFSAIHNVGGERGSIIVLNEKEQVLDTAFVYESQLKNNTTRQLKETIEHGLAGWVARNQEAALVHDTSQDPRWMMREDDSIERTGAKSAICVPIAAQNKLVGVLTLVHHTPGTFNQDHLDLIKAIADQAGIAILNARLFSESQRQARVMTALAESAARLNSSVRIDDLYQTILTQTRLTLQVEVTALALVDDNELVFTAASERGRELTGKRIQMRQGIAGLVAHEGHGGIFTLADPENRTDWAEFEDIRGFSASVVACAPIRVKDKIIGILEAINPISKSFDTDTLLVLTGLGALAGTNIQNAQLFESLDSARKHYHDLFEDNIDPIIITDQEGKILEINRQAALFTGFPFEMLRQMRIGQVHDINYEKTGSELEHIEESTITYESTLHDSRLNKHPIQVHARKVEFDDAISIQWILRNITERKELDSLREDLAAMIYHDLRSPLANILSSVEMLDDIMPEAGKDSAGPIFQIARQSIKRIERMTTSLLDINRLEQNQAVGELQAVEMSAVITYAMDAANPSIEGRAQRVVLRLDESLPKVMVDLDMIRRVLINLLENAAKYTPVGGEIEIGSFVREDFLHTYILDNGPGIVAEDRERVFDKFVRLKNKTSARGLGVGLAFCRLAVQGHGGKIWVEPAPVRGSKFIFSLPIKK